MKRILKKWGFPVVLIGMYFGIIALFLFLIRPGIVWSPVSHRNLPLKGVALEIEDAELTTRDKSIQVTLKNDTECEIGGTCSMEKLVDGTWMTWDYEKPPRVDAALAFLQKDAGPEEPVYLGVSAYDESTAALSLKEFLPKIEPGEYRLVLDGFAQYYEEADEPILRYRTTGCLFAYFTIE